MDPWGGLYLGAALYTAFFSHSSRFVLFEEGILNEIPEPLAVIGSSLWQKNPKKDIGSHLETVHF